MKKNLLLSIMFLYCLFSSFWIQASPDNKIAPKLTQREDVKAFIQKMVKEHQFEEKELNQWFNAAHLQPGIIASMTKPAEALSWDRYQGIFLTPERIKQGADFLRTHAKTLTAAQQKYGVPAEVIVAILGVETFYGARTGQYSVLDSLITLGFDYPPRSKFFLSELEQFLLLAREEHWDPTLIKGSYAGAMGSPQFISSSYRNFAVDFSNDGKRDLLGNIDDAIGSIANYFKLCGWQADNNIIVLPAAVKGEQYKAIIAAKGNPKPSHTLVQLTPLGIQAQSKNLPEQSFAFIVLEGTKGPEYWLGGHNFYVITRYNHSTNYAMAVYNLSQKIKTLQEQGSA